MKALAPGSIIGVVAPAGPPLPFHDVNAGIEYLESLGYTVETARSDFRPHGYLCGTDEERLRELNTFIRREDVAAIFCVRGGYGALRLLPDLDYEVARAHPKLLVGYSDITALQLALYARSGWKSIAGPMVGVEWPQPDPDSERLFWDLVQGRTPAPLTGPERNHLLPLREGQAEGTLIGGNLSLICRLIGTPYLPDLTGSILFVEDVGEEPYRLDGLFAHLRLSGILDRLGGLVLGSFTDATPRPDRPSLTVEQVIDDYASRLSIPVASGLAFGHYPVKASIPIGVRARLTVGSDAARLDVLESVI